METFISIVLLFTILSGLTYLYFVFSEQLSALKRARRIRAQVIADLESGYIKE